MNARILIGATLLGLAAAAPAQVPNPSPTAELPQDRGYDKDTPKHEAIDAQEAPVTRSLNATSDLGATVKADATAADQAQYDADRAAYRAQVGANRREAMRDEARYDRQQRAYADAMAQWRAQTAACNRGKLKACKLPTPNPADYY